ncbi:DUF3817 domain-containing protein [Glutamicibacter sp. NPDC087344]|uniref:DUF3817 domain-containing protein n=1 Tax=Glutamicibacter sp. NPDC087344 TaxID=3363994 RepID=UPI0037F70B1A
MSPSALFRTVARAEAVTWTLLLIAMFLKYVVKVGDWPVSIAGFVHGFVFLSYVATGVLVGINQRWSKRSIVLTAATSVVPYLTIPYERRLTKLGRLEGQWRTTKSDHPDDAKRIDTLFRWMVGRPLLTAVSAVVIVGLVFTAMLIMGPPGGGA